MKLYYGIFLCLISVLPVFSQENPMPTDSNNVDTQPIETPTTTEANTSIDVNKLQELPVVNEEKSKQISQYFEEALKNYEEILSQERSSEVKTTSRRIENNIELLKQHRENLNTSESDLRKMRVEYMERYLLLKNAYEKGRIDKKTYQRQLEQLAQDYRFKMSAVLNDRDFYHNQTQKTEERLKELEEFNRINKIVLAQEGVTINPQQPQEPPNEFEKIIRDIRKLGCFEVKNFCASPEFK